MIKKADMLTQDSVSILTINEDGTYHRCCYMNSVSDRASIVANEPEEIVAEVMEVWGEKPTLEEEVWEEPPKYGLPELVDPAPSENVWDELAAAIKQGVNNV